MGINRMNKYIIFMFMMLTACSHQTTVERPLTDPIYNYKFIENWSALTATEVMTFGFHDYQRRFYNSSKNFTESGWNSFTKAIQKARIIENVEVHKQVVSSTITGVPIVTNTEIINNRYYWTVQIPLLVIYENETKIAKRNLTVELHVARTSNDKNEDDIGIESWVAKLK